MFVLFNPLGLECFANFITHKVTRKVFFAHIYIIKSVNVIQYEKNHQIMDIIFQFVACIIRYIEVAKEMYCMIFSQSSQPTPNVFHYVTQVFSREIIGQITLGC